MKLLVKNANNIVDYFDRNSDIYEDFSIQFLDFDKVEIIFRDELTQEAKEDRKEDIENIIYSAHL